MMINFLLGFLLSLNLFQLFIIVKFCNFDLFKKEKVVIDDYDKLKKESPDVAIEKSAFFR